MNRSDVTDFRALIHWIAEEYHAGHFYPIAARTGVSAGLIDQWKRGIVGKPRPESVAKLLRAYPLDPQWVLSLIPSDYAGLLPPPKRGKRKATAMVVAALSVLGMASTAMGSTGAPLPATTGADALRDGGIMSRRRRPLRSYGWPFMPALRPMG